MRSTQLVVTVLIFTLALSAMAYPPKVLNQPKDICVEEDGTTACKDFFGGGVNPPVASSCPTNACSLQVSECIDANGNKVDWSKEYFNWNVTQKKYKKESPGNTAHLHATQDISYTLCLKKRKCTCANIGQGMTQCVELITSDFIEDEILATYQLNPIPDCLVDAPPPDPMEP
jgi:hypothetical protein